MRAVMKLVGLLGIGAVVMSAASGCAVQTASDGSASTDEALSCMPADWVTIGIAKGYPAVGKALEIAYPRNMVDTRALDAPWPVLEAHAQWETRCLLRALETFAAQGRCAGKTAPDVTKTQWCEASSPTVIRQFDITRCKGITVADIQAAFAKDQKDQRCANAAPLYEVFKSGPDLPDFGGVWVSFDPVGGGPNKG